MSKIPGTELPPVISQLIGDASSAIDAIDEVIARLTALSQMDVEVNIGINQTAVDAGLADIETKVKSLSGNNVSIGLTADTGSLVAARAEIDAILGRPVTIPVEISATGLAATALGSAAAGGAGAAAGAGGYGILGTLMWGGGGILGIGAGVGSIMSLAGFGLEHLVTTVGSIKQNDVRSPVKPIWVI